MRALLKNRFVLFTTYFLAVLFIYTGVSKLLDVGIFQSQIAQSAMLAPYASILAWLVPVVELLLAGLLLINNTRIWGLLGGAVLMLGFTVYVYLIWTYSPSLPCSCGGVLEAMDWETHLYFNLGTTLLAGTAWYIDSDQTNHYTVLVTSSVGILGLVLLLFYSQPQPSILQDDSFTRRHQENTLTPIAEQKLAFNSYYVAGVTDSLVYLGNSTGFTHGIVWNYKTNDTTHFRIRIPNAPEQFVSLPKWQVHEDYFFMGEGVSPSLYRGKVGKWEAQEFMDGVPYYNDLVVIKEEEFIIRTFQSSIQKDVLANYWNTKPYIIMNDVLEQDIENIYQTDGSLIWDSKQRKASYLYFYKNRIIHWNEDFSNQETTNLLYDIVAEIKTHKSRDGTYLRETDQNPFHTKLRTWNKKYYILSNIMGTEESLYDFNRNSTLDIYDSTYIKSKRIPNKNGEKASDFYV